MKKLSLILVLASFISLVSACGDAQDPTSEVSAIPIPSAAVKLGSKSNGCGSNLVPQLKFGGLDARNHALYTFEVGRLSNVGRNSCDIVGQLLIERGYRVRIKGVSYRGNYFRGGNAFGKVNIYSSLSTGGTHQSVTNVPSVTPFIGSPPP
mgnify:CR=1 FL=1